MKYSYRTNAKNTLWARFVSDIIGGKQGLVFVALCGNWVALLFLESWFRSSFNREVFSFSIGGLVSFSSLFLTFFILRGLTQNLRDTVARVSVEADQLVFNTEVDEAGVRQVFKNHSIYCDWTGLSSWKADDSSIILSFYAQRIPIAKHLVGAENFVQTIDFLKRRNSKTGLVDRNLHSGGEPPLLKS